MKLSRSLGIPLVLAGLAAACGTTEPQQMQQPAVLSSVSGSGQTGEPGQALPNPVVVQVRQGATAVPGQTVSWGVTAGGGSVNPASSSTDNAGMASTTWTLGPNEGANSLEATVAGLTGSPTTFVATGVMATPPPMTAAVSVGDFFFDPTSSRLAVGGTVTWTWNGAVGHNVTFASETPDTKVTGTRMRTFNAAGSFPYQCTIHPGSMNGTIVVE